jgi:hypothetical protein
MVKVKIKKFCFHETLGALRVGDVVEVHEAVAQVWGENTCEIVGGKSTKVETPVVDTKVETDAVETKGDEPKRKTLKFNK